ncbi:MAG: glycosyltransferase [Elusimicrobiota bacterium]
MIVATWNEAFHIGASLKRLRQISTQGPFEVIVVDGHSDDATAASAREWADSVIVHERTNFGEQLHLGAQQATGELFLFMRGDAQLSGNWQQALEHFWLAPDLKGVAATAFTVEFGSSRSARLASFLSNGSARWRGSVSLHHGLCTTSDIYRYSGGFPPLPCLADHVFCGKLRSQGRLVMLPERIWPSASRLHRQGVLGCVGEHLWLELRFKFGVSPEELWRQGRGCSP